MFVYAEDVFVLNCIADMLILCFVFKYEIKVNSKYILRILLISIFESVLVVLLINKSLAFKAFGKMLLLFVVAWAASLGKNYCSVVSNFFLIMVSSFVFCGAIMFVGNGLSFFNLPALSKFCSFAAGCALALTACFCFDRGIRDKVRLFPRQSSCCVCVNGKKIEGLTLFADTGNLLKTAFGQSIVVLDERIFKRLSGLNAVKSCALHDYVSFYDALPDELKAKAGFKLVKGIGGATVYVTLKPDFIIIEGHSVDNVLIMPGNFSGSSFDGIYNPIFFLKENSEGYEL